MSEFERRERAFERKHELDREIGFMVAAHAAKAMARWAAEQMGLRAEEAQLYVKSVLDIDLMIPHHAALVAKIENDFKARNLDISRHHIVQELADKVDEARKVHLAQ